MSKEEMKLMREMSAVILIDLLQSGLDAHQAMAVLAQTATSGFYAEGLSREEALERFAEVVAGTYDRLDEQFKGGMQ